MAYDIHTFATSSAYYSEYTKGYVYTLLAASYAVYNAAIDFALAKIRYSFDVRPLFVLFEESLGCDPATDHVAPKNVYSIYAYYIETSLKQLKTMQKTSLIVHLESLIFSVVYEELKLRLQAQKQVESLSIEGQVLRSTNEQLDYMVREQQDELQDMRGSLYRFKFLYYQYLTKKHYIGRTYRPDFQTIHDENAAEKHNNDLYIMQLRRYVLYHMQDKEQLYIQLSAALNNLRDLDLYRDYAIAYQSQLAKLQMLLAEFSKYHDDSLREYKTRVEILKDENEQIPALIRENDELKMRLDRLEKLLAATELKSSKKDEEYQAEIASLKQQLKSTVEHSKWYERQLKQAYEQLYQKKTQDKRQQKSGTPASQNSSYVNTDATEANVKVSNATDRQRKLDRFVSEAAERYYVYKEIIQRLTGLECALENAEIRKTFKYALQGDDKRVTNEADAYIARLKLDSKIIARCHYLYKFHPTFKDVVMQTEDVLRESEQLSECPQEVEEYGYYYFSSLVSVVCDVNHQKYANKYAKRCNSRDNIVFRPDNRDPKSRSRDQKDNYALNSADYQSEHYSAVLMNEIDDDEDNPLCVLQGLKNALNLVEEARVSALDSLEQYLDKQVQTDYEASSFEPERAIKARRAGARAGLYLKLSKFTVQYQQSNFDYDIPEVFRRLYEAAKEIALRHSALRKQLEEQTASTFIRQRSAFEQSSGISVASVLRGNSMLRVDRGNSDTGKLQRVYDLPAKNEATRRSTADSVVLSKQRDMSVKAELSDKELFDAVFDMKTAKEANYYITLKSSY